MVFDSTIWIDALNGIKSPKTDLLKEKSLSNEVVLLPVIVQEILQGIKDDNQYLKVKNNLSGFQLLDLNQWESYAGAAALYRFLRKKGVTIRKANDCLISFQTMMQNLELVHNDSDFDQIAKYCNLKIYNQKY